MCVEEKEIVLRLPSAFPLNPSAVQREMQKVILILMGTFQTYITGTGQVLAVFLS